MCPIDLFARASEVRLFLGVALTLVLLAPTGAAAPPDDGEATPDVPAAEESSAGPPAVARSLGGSTELPLDEELAYVPLGRNLVSVFRAAPGVNDGGGLGTTNSSLSGSSGLENVYLVDGVEIGHAGYGALGTFSQIYGGLGTGFTTSFLDSVEVRTGALGVDVVTAGGGTVEAELRSGTNDFTFDLSWFQTLGSLEGDRLDVVRSPNAANPTELERRDLAAGASGAILQDRLFWFAGYNPVRTEERFKLTSGNGSLLYDLDGDGTADDMFPVGATIRGGRVPAEVTRTRETDNYAARFTWFATRNHKFDLSLFGDPSDGEAGAQSPQTTLRGLADPFGVPDPSSVELGLDYGGDRAALRYQGIWTPNWFTDLGYARSENDFTESGGATNAYSVFQVNQGIAIGGIGFYEEQTEETERFRLASTHILGPVELTWGAELEEIRWGQPTRYSGPAYTEYFPNLVDDGTGPSVFAPGCSDSTDFDDPACYTPWTSATGALVSAGFGGISVDRTEFLPADDGTESEGRHAFLQATWEATPRWTFLAGTRYTEQELKGSGGATLPFGFDLSLGVYTGALTTTLTPQSYTFDGELAPRLGAIWDVAGDGRHKVYANAARYLQRIPNDLALRAFSNSVSVNQSDFVDPALTMPALTEICGFDSDGDGLADSNVACHRPTSVSGLFGGGSLVLDGTQLDAGSELNTALGINAQLTTGDATKLPYTDELLLGWAWQIDDASSLELRAIDRELGRALEDVQFTSNEQTWNLFWGASGGVDCGTTPPFPPGCSFGDPFEGAGAGPFGAYVYANVGDNVSDRLFPVPTRDYRALEAIYSRRFEGGTRVWANWRWAELEGNYEGSYRNDTGQFDPYLSALFDFPAASAVDSNGDGTFDTFTPSATLAGQYVDGPLPTDRRHIVNAFASHSFDFGLFVGGRATYRTGQPLTPLYAHPAYQSAGQIPATNPIYWWGVNVDADGDGVADGLGFLTGPPGPSSPPSNSGIDFNGDGTPDTIVGGFVTGPRLFSYDPAARDALGRTEDLLTLDLGVGYDLALRDGASRLRFVLDVFNVLDETEVQLVDTNVEVRTGIDNVNYLRGQRTSEPRTVRLGAQFTW